MVKCAECGFLAVRNPGTGEPDQATDAYRETGSTQPWGDYDAEYPPLCFVREYPLQREASQFRNEIWPEPNIHWPELRSRLIHSTNEVIQRERECSRFNLWQQGFTPKEHREMLDRKWERRWRLIELGVLALLGGAFTALGAWIVATFGQ